MNFEIEGVRSLLFMALLTLFFLLTTQQRGTENLMFTTEVMQAALLDFFLSPAWGTLAEVRQRTSLMH
jgi:hypothetical protein